MQYEIQHSPDGVSGWSDPVIVEGEAFTLTGLPTGEDHFARVRSRNPVSGEVSSWAPIVTATPTVGAWDEDVIWQ